ncbi:MAG: gamma-glutamyltranspeptidase / glutathione hydrolase [Rhodospirillaceae bacterium]|jgi:gamma-glutamyltranspeptidase/glutathione hydrolase|nr:gamma-glutamyltranspeptidase / glutathione hydrolase [Rhodospirillaceae bacterium]
MGTRNIASRLAIYGALALFLGFAATPAPAASLPPVEATHGMVVSAQRLGSSVGLDILKQGGNAMDAAVAVGYALAVTHPCCGNLGGGGFMLMHLAAGRDVVVDFRETAPLAASRDMYLDAAGNPLPDASTKGYKAVGVPGTVLGLDTALQRYGSMDRARVMAPAIALAEEGFVLGDADVAILKYGAKEFAGEPNVAAIFLKNGASYAAGDRLIQPQLAATLKLIAKAGPDAFYRGPVAKAIVEASRQHGGILSLEDFERYRVVEREPLRCSYRGYDIAAAPPPSSGGTTICEILGIVENHKLADLGFHSAASVHVMVEAMRHAFLDRNNRLGDPAFVANPISQLLAKDYLSRLSAAIDPARATASSALNPGTPPHEGTQTTHYSIVDAAGNAVAVTYTINSYFGASVIAGDTGFFLNNEMDDFTAKPGSPNMFGLVQGEANAIEPGKRPLSSMSPTIVSRDGKIFLVLGSPGGSRIISAITQVISNVVDYGMDIQAAVDAPRFHHQWLPDKIYVEPFELSRDTSGRLTAMGHTIAEQQPWGAVEAILIGPPAPIGKSATAGLDDSTHASATTPGHLYGASDSRRPGGAAMGY